LLVGALVGLDPRLQFHGLDSLLAVLTRHLRHTGAIGGLGQARQCPRSGARRATDASGDVLAVLDQGAPAHHGGGYGQAPGGQGQPAIHRCALHRLFVGRGVLGGPCQLGAGGADDLGSGPGASGGQVVGDQAGVVPQRRAGGLAVPPFLLEGSGAPGLRPAQVGWALARRLERPAWTVPDPTAAAAASILAPAHSRFSSVRPEASNAASRCPNDAGPTGSASSSGAPSTASATIASSAVAFSTSLSPPSIAPS